MILHSKPADDLISKLLPMTTAMTAADMDKIVTQIKTKFKNDEQNLHTIISVEFNNIPTIDLYNNLQVFKYLVSTLKHVSQNVA
ncbi:Hypothetical protein CINCED_3A010226 [Cinara cedri]|uniref:Uncharacterized protein n=1 Tax=Cinara cedri TaxID=506608 RepID=A0A5E4M912_9HEMI|nr:Hypothetical protein CINCED_3A010226 [Cinara cedri]